MKNTKLIVQKCPRINTQVEPLKEIIKSLGYSLIEIPKVEADDVIGTLALKDLIKVQGFYCYG